MFYVVSSALRILPDTHVSKFDSECRQRSGVRPASATSNWIHRICAQDLGAQSPGFGYRRQANLHPLYHHGFHTLYRCGDRAFVSDGYVQLPLTLATVAETVCLFCLPFVSFFPCVPCYPGLLCCSCLLCERCCSHRQLPRNASPPRHQDRRSRVAAACPKAAAHNCALAQSMCMQHVPHGDQGSMCSCFQHLGICLRNAGCLNGANENLQTKYCETGDSYCCNNRGEFNGCGTRWPFTGREMCRCEEPYGGIFCNTTSANCATGASCTVCSACCKGYTQDTCNECVSHECDRNVCNAGASCTACPACCKSYLEGPQADCNICVETECGASR